MKKIALAGAAFVLSGCSAQTELTGRILWTQDGCAYSVTESSDTYNNGVDISARLNRSPDLDAPECSAPPRP